MLNKGLFKILRNKFSIFAIILSLFIYLIHIRLAVKDHTINNNMSLKHKNIPLLIIQTMYTSTQLINTNKENNLKKKSQFNSKKKLQFNLKKRYITQKKIRT